MNKTFILLRLHLSDLWGINRLRHSEEKRGRRRIIGMAVLALILTPVFLLYIVGAAMVLVTLGLASYIPALMLLVSALLIIFTTFMKSSTLLFGGNDHDILASLPVSGRSILASRILTLYIHQLPFSLLIMLPSLIVYAIFTHPSAAFYILSLPLTLLMPLIPIVVSAAVGALITWLGSCFRHKSLMTTVLSVLLVVVLIVGPSLLSGRTAELLEGGDLTALTAVLEPSLRALTGAYPPAVWYAGALGGNVASLLCFLLANAVFFFLFLVVMDRYGDALRRAVTARGRSGRQIRSSDFKTSSAFAALYKKELKRLFSSSIYLMNTTVGGLLAVIFSVMVFFVPIDKVFGSFGIPADASAVQITAIAALVVSLALSIMSTTSAAISLEGRNVWLLQSLPVTTQTILHAKSAVDLTIKLPCIVLSALLFTIGLKLNIWSFCTFLAVPLVYSLFASQVGLLMDIRKPNYTWTNEAQVVKQGLSVLFSMLVGMISVALPALALFLLGVESAVWILSAACLLLLCATVLIHRKISRIRI